jgi:TetR/AcrR family transcriptional regulator
MDPENTREKIRKAAFLEFAEKGFDGARMQSIADRAAINKAMVHYYYGSKQELFKTIIRETFEELMNLFSGIRMSDPMSPEDLVSRLVSTHIRFLADHPHMPAMVIRDLTQEHSELAGIISEVAGRLKDRKFSELSDFLARESRHGLVRDVDPVQTIWSIVAMNLFPFVAKPVISAIWPGQTVDDPGFVERREKAVIDLLLYGLLPRDQDPSSGKET